MKIGISSSSLKLIACATMLFDHIGFLFFPDHLWWRVIGRISFPLFALLIAEGYRHTSNIKRYASRLFLFAFVSQIPFILFLRAAGVDGFTLNIFFTLGAGLIALWTLRLRPQYAMPLIACISLAAELLRFDYGAYGVLTILAGYLFLVRRKPGIAALTLLPFLQTFLQLLSGIFFVQFTAILSVPFVTAYNGERGRQLPRYFFYSFYPVHLALLWLIWFLI